MRKVALFILLLMSSMALAQTQVDLSFQAKGILPIEHVQKCLNVGESWTWTGSMWQCQIPIGQAGRDGINGTNGTNGAPGAPGYSPNQILSGCGVVWTAGLQYTVSPCTYLIQNVQYTTPLSTVTLDPADSTNDRIDVIAVDTSQAVIRITGTPAVNPVPAPIDVSTQLQLTFSPIGAGATIPSNIVTTDLYHENTEWPCASTANFNCNSTNNPHAGAKDVEATNAVTGNNFRLTIPSGTLDLATRNNLIFLARSKAAWATTRSLTIQWYNGTTPKCSPVTLKTGNFTFDSSNTTAYQQIVIPLPVFACSGVPVTRVQFTVSGTGTGIGFYVDDVILQGGVTPPTSSPGLNPKGFWQPNTAYSVNDMVWDGGGSWYALAANTSSEPSPTNTNWFSMGSIAPLIEQCPNPAQSGVVRLCNLSKLMWRNQLGTADCGIGFENNVFSIDPCGATGSEWQMTGESGAAATTPSVAGVFTFHIDPVTGFTCSKDSAGVDHCPGSGSGTVLGVSGTAPIVSSGGTTPAISCPTCVISVTGTSPVASSGGTTPAISINAGGITSTQLANANKTRTCHIVYGSDDAAADLTTAQIQPQHDLCFFDVAATILQVTVHAAGGTPNIIVSKRHTGSQTALLSSALSTAAAGAVACSNTGGTTGIDGATTCSATLQNTTVAAGDYADATGGATSAGAKYFSVDITFRVN